MGDRAVRISKFLSLVLRHRPEEIGLGLDQSGWASVGQLIEASRRRAASINCVADAQPA